MEKSDSRTALYSSSRLRGKARFHGSGTAKRDLIDPSFQAFETQA